MDREKIIKGLEICTNISPDGCLMLCPYKDEKDETYSGFCEQVLKQDALSLLKEQEATQKDGYNLQELWKRARAGETLNETELIRCKDCKHWYFADNRIPSEQENVCGRNGIVVTTEWFCADGERKEK